jgi:hypothetical protein
MNKKRFLILGIMIAVLAGLTLGGCALFKSLTADQKARIVADLVQDQLQISFMGAKDFMALHEDDEALQEAWKGKIVPAVDVTNRTLRDVMQLLGNEQTVELLRSRLSADDAKIILGTMLNSAITSWKWVIKVSLGDIPEWSDILAKNAAFQMDIDAEME